MWIYKVLHAIGRTDTKKTQRVRSNSLFQLIDLFSLFYLRFTREFVITKSYAEELQGKNRYLL